MFGVREEKIYREREVKIWNWFHAQHINRNCRSMDRGAIEIYQALNLNRSKSVKDLSTAKIPRWIEKLSRIYGPDRKFLDGSKKLLRIYRKETQKSWWIKILIRSVKKRRKRGSIEDNLSRICREAVELEKNVFFKEGKNT